MALTDYSTAEEKIAAFKCAMMDPALVNRATTEFTTSDDIYIITNLVNLQGKCYHDNASAISCKISSDTLISSYRDPTYPAHCYGFLYINDSDIVYADPITLYKNRLSNMISCDSLFGGFTVGVNNALIIASPTAQVYIDGCRYVGCRTFTNSYNLMLPVKSGYVISGSARHIDLPADW